MVSSDVLGHKDVNFEFITHIVCINICQEEMVYTCISAAFSDFVNEFKRTIDSVEPIWKVTVKANLKPWFNTKIASRYKKSGSETN